MRSEKLLIQLQSRIKILEEEKKECHERCEALKKELADLKKQHEKCAPAKSSRSRKKAKPQEE